MSASLVVCFSATGTTEAVAEKVARAASADLFRIVPEVPYTSADLDWQDSTSRSSRENADESARPAIASEVPDMAGYGVVYVGFPVWWYVEPRIIDTFLEACDLAGKTVVPFCTSGSSGLGQIPARMQTLCPGARVGAGRRLAAGESQQAIDAWVKGMPLPR